MLEAKPFLMCELAHESVTHREGHLDLDLIPCFHNQVLKKQHKLKTSCLQFILLIGAQLSTRAWLLQATLKALLDTLKCGETRTSKYVQILLQRWKILEVKPLLLAWVTVKWYYLRCLVGLWALLLIIGHEKFLVWAVLVEPLCLN